MEQHDLLNANPHLPEEFEGLKQREIQERLPPIFKDILCHHFRPQDHLIALFAVLITSVVLIPNIYVQYAGKRSYPYLFLMLLLPPAGGKSALGLARTLILGINRKLAKDFEEKFKSYQRDLAEFKKGKLSSGPSPPNLQLVLLPGNTTSARFNQQLAENGENVPLVVLETEMDSVSAMFTGEHGTQNSVLLRQVFHNEPVSSARKGDRETLVADKPKLAMLLSGTESQISALFNKGTQDGLFSRFLVLDLVGNMKWESPRPKKGEKPIEDWYQEYGNLYLKLWQQTQDLEIEIKFTNEQWDQLDLLGEKFQKQAHLVGGQYAVSLARRHILMATRFCTILTFFRQVDPLKKTVPVFSKVLIPIAADLQVSMELTEFSFRKALALFQRMPSTPPVKANSTRQFNFFKYLPEEFFMRDANKVAEKLKIPTRTKDRWLSEFVETGALERIEKGHYRKCQVALMAVAESEE